MCAIEALNVAAYLTKALVLGFSACIMPGVFQTFLISETLQRGWRRGLLVALGPLLSDGPVIVVVLLLLNHLPAWSLSLLQAVGGMYVLYLAWSAWRAARSAAAVEVAPARAGEERRSMLQAATINLLNPAVYLYWATVSGPLLAQGWQRAPGLAAAFLVAFYGALLGTEVVLVALVSRVRQLKPELTRWLLLASSVAMAALGVAQIVAGVRGLLA